MIGKEITNGHTTGQRMYQDEADTVFERRENMHLSILVHTMCI